jgi:hypothetical protein
MPTLAVFQGYRGVIEQLASRFDRKAGMRETWLGENQRLVFIQDSGLFRVQFRQVSQVYTIMS